MPFDKQPNPWKYTREPEPKASPIQPPHYDFPGGVRVIDLTQHLNFCRGNVVKYVCRAGRKSGAELEDLRKAAWYLSQEIARLESQGSG